VPADAVRAAGVGFDSTFDDRFSAIRGGSSSGAGSKLQEVIDLFSGRVTDP
jgi:hypothetical protein